MGSHRYRRYLLAIVCIVDRRENRSDRFSLPAARMNSKPVAARSASSALEGIRTPIVRHRRPLPIQLDHEGVLLGCVFVYGSQLQQLFPNCGW